MSSKRKREGGGPEEPEAKRARIAAAKQAQLERVAGHVERQRTDGERLLLFDTPPGSVLVEMVLAQVPVGSRGLSLHGAVREPGNEVLRHRWAKLAPCGECYVQQDLDKLRGVFFDASTCGFRAIRLGAQAAGQAALWGLVADDLAYPSGFCTKGILKRGEMLPTMEHLGQRIVDRERAGIAKVGQWLKGVPPAAEHKDHLDWVLYWTIVELCFRAMFAVPDSNLSNLLCVGPARVDGGHPQVIGVDAMLVGRPAAQIDPAAGPFFGLILRKLPSKAIAAMLQTELHESESSLRKELTGWLQRLNGGNLRSFLVTLGIELHADVLAELDSGRCAERVHALLAGLDAELATGNTAVAAPVAA